MCYYSIKLTENSSPYDFGSKIILYVTIRWLCIHIGEGHCKGKKGKVFYGQEPPNGESITTECGVNYQLLAVITEAAQWGTSSCSQPQLATDNGVRDGRSN